MARVLIRRRRSKPRKRQRSFNRVSHYFHNFEHDPQGRTHCRSNGQHPYQIEHLNGQHVITRHIAVGHGRGGKPQAFVFKRKRGKGFDLESGVRVDKAPKR